MKKNILVFPCGSEIGLEIYESVKYSTYFHLIGASSVEDHGRYVYDDYISGLPFFDDEALIPELKRIIAERAVEAIFPTMDSVITVLKEHEAEIGCLVVAPPAETTEICLSKRSTYELLKDIIRVPEEYTADNVREFPVFIKPEIGYGAIGTKLAKSADDLSIVAGRPDLMIVEYLPGAEYTVDCFTDRHGVLRYSAARLRERIKSGISVSTHFVENQQEFVEAVEKIGSVIKFRGPWFAQFKRDSEGRLCLMEIAARLGGASTLSRAVGVNFSLLALFDLFEYEVSVEPQNYGVELDRSLASKFKVDIEYDTVYVDYDDCLILDKTTVNTELVHFLYQCLNKKKRLILLTKHADTIFDELRDCRLLQLFDEVINIRHSDNKADHISCEKAIFIDDSFAERENIRNNCGIPVFSPEMVCVLMK